MRAAFLEAARQELGYTGEPLQLRFTPTSHAVTATCRPSSEVRNPSPGVSQTDTIWRYLRRYRNASGDAQSGYARRDVPQAGNSPSLA